MTEQRFIIYGAGLAALAILVLVKKKDNLAQDVGAGLGKAVVDAAAGAVLGIGDAIGIPRTNKTKCELAIEEGRYWDASFDCPAGTFLGGVGSGIGGAVYDWTH